MCSCWKHPTDAFLTFGVCIWCWQQGRWRRGRSRKRRWRTRSCTPSAPPGSAPPEGRSDLNWEVLVVLFTLLNVRSFGGLDLLLNIGHVTGLHLSVKTCFNIPFFSLSVKTSPLHVKSASHSRIFSYAPFLLPWIWIGYQPAANDRICFLVGKIIQQATKAFSISSYQYTPFKFITF